MDHSALLFRNVSWSTVGIILVISSLCSPAQVAADDWSGSLGIANVWLSSSGSEDSLRTQNLGEDGFLLEELDLRFEPENGGTDFSLSAWGFGDAESSEGFNLKIGCTSGLRFEMKYAKANSFFALHGGDLASRHDEWDLTRWFGSLTWDGWQDWTLALELRNVQRDGLVYREHYGLNEFYPIGINLDEVMNEISLRVESRAWPVHLVFEQSFARYERENRPFAAGSEAISNPQDPDLLAAIGSDSSDIQEVPTTRLAASWSQGRWEGVITLLYSATDLESNGTIFDSYAVGGGEIGTLSFIDELVGSTEMDSLAGALRLGFKVAQDWTIRLNGTYRDTSADSALLGRRLLHTVNPSGQEFDIEGVIDENGFYDFTDSDLRLTVDWQHGAFGAWAGASVAARDVNWQRTTDGSITDVSRDSDGLLAGVSWSPSTRLQASVEYESDSFERYVFRTDPEEVDRWTARLTSRLGGGWRLGFHARQEQATNPSEIAAFDSDSSAFGTTISWGSNEGAKSVGLSLNKIDLTTETDIFLPGSEAALSVYDLNLMNLTLYGRMSFNRFHIDARASYTEDDGATWPVDAFNAGARLMMDGPANTQFGVFAQYWDYNEEQTDLDDYEATRYGVSIRWRFSR